VALATPLATNAQQAAPPKQPTITDVDSYQPREAIAAGTEHVLPLTTGSNPLLSAEAWDKMRAYSDEHGGVGLIVLVDGKVAGESYRAGAGPTTQTLSQSMHKSIVGLAYGIAIRDGIIKSAGDPVGRYIVEWRNDPRGQIPLRAFLTMSSGLKDYSMARREPQSAELVFGKDIVATALGSPIARPALTTFIYTNFDAQIAGIALERAVKAKTGKRYAAWLSDVLWQPLGNGPASVWLDHEGGTPHYFAWFETDLRSWARVGELIRNEGRVGKRQLIPASWIKQATAPSATNPNYGYLIWRGTPWKAHRQYAADNPLTVPHSAAYSVDDIVFFDGFGGQRVYVSPSRKLVIARTGEVDMAFDDAILPNLALAGLPK
jgi:CubicO group peptidase (beta-lactamase class C family)